MKKLINILRIISGVLVVAVAFVFLIIEGTLLVTLDFALYENQIVGFVQLTARLLLAIFALTLGILSIAKPRRSFLPESICLLASTAVMLLFVSNNFGIYLTALAVLFFSSHLLFHKFAKDK